MRTCLPARQGKKAKPMLKSFLPAAKSSIGFTLIELLIVAAVIAILLIIVLARLGLFGQQSEVSLTAQRIISTLEIARNQTLASEGETVYGVHFESDKYVLFKGTTYSSIDPDNKEFTLSVVEIFDTIVTGGNDVVFTRIRGTTANSGDIKIRSISDTSRTATILINFQGQVSLLESTISPTSQITDTRHVHINIGFPIDTANSMELRFFDPTNPDVVENVDIPSFVSSGKFDWEGAVDVYGSDQTLRIHSHGSLSPDTQLSIHRDRRFNDKALKISIDSTLIITYDENGTITSFINLPDIQ